VYFPLAKPQNLFTGLMKQVQKLRFTAISKGKGFHQLQIKRWLCFYQVGWLFFFVLQVCGAALKCMHKLHKNLLQNVCM